MAPVTNDAAGLRRNAAARPNSDGSPSRRSGMRSAALAFAAAGSSWRASSSATRSVPTRPGSRPFTRMPRGPSSSASCLATIARPGRRPLEMAIWVKGPFTLVDRTNAIEPPASSFAATSRAVRTAPRNTAANDAVHCSSVVVATLPAGGPPTLISAPSSLPHRSWAAAISRAGVCGSALSPTTYAARSPSAATAAVSVSSERPDNTTRAPSWTSTSAVARPSPRPPPVTTKTRSVSPRSMARTYRRLGRSVVARGRLQGRPGVGEELRAVEVGVEATLREELGVGAALDNTSGLEHQDQVRVTHGGESVGDHQGGTPGQGRVECALHRDLGLAVEVGGRLVEHDDRRRLEEEAGDRQ